MAKNKKKSVKYVYVTERCSEYKAIILEEREKSIFVHFETFSKRHDRWISRSDPALRWPHADDAPSRRSPEKDPSRDSVSRSSHNSESQWEKGEENSVNDLPPETVIEEMYDEMTRVTRNTAKRLRDKHSDPEDSKASPKRRRSSSSTRSSNSRTSARARLAAFSVATDGGARGAAAAAPGDGAGAPLHPSPRDRPDAVGVPADPLVHNENLNFNSMCGLCRLPVGRASIECHGCKNRFHPDVLCLGVGEDVIKVLRSNNLGAISYHCCSCRIGDPTMGGGLPQLTKIVGELVRTVRSRASDNVSPGATAPREAIITQIREVKEREKRKDSIIFRGLGDVSVGALASSFRVICDLLRIGHVSLSEIRKIGSSPPLYRARVVDDTKRRELLLRCHQLRNTEEFGRVFIHKDLTLQQRRDLMAKRNRAVVQRGNSRRSPPQNMRRTLGEFIPVTGRTPPPSSPRNRGGRVTERNIDRGLSRDQGSGGRGGEERRYASALRRGPPRGRLASRGRGLSRGRGSSSGRGSSLGRLASRGRGISGDQGAARGRGRAPSQTSRVPSGRGPGRGSRGAQRPSRADALSEFGDPMASSSPAVPMRERPYYGNFQEDIQNNEQAPSYRGGGRGYFPRRNVNLN